MFVGKALSVTISGFDKNEVQKAADNYCRRNGFRYWTNVYREFRLFQWRWEYKVELYKPVDFKIEKITPE